MTCQNLGQKWFEFVKKKWKSKNLKTLFSTVSTIILFCGLLMVSALTSSEQWGCPRSKRLQPLRRALSLSRCPLRMLPALLIALLKVDKISYKTPSVNLIVLFQVLLVQLRMVVCMTGGDCRSMWRPSSSSSPACSSSPSTSGMQEGGSPWWRTLQSTQMTAALVTTASTAPSATGNITFRILLTLSHHYLAYSKISLKNLWHYRPIISHNLPHILVPQVRPDWVQG